VSASPFTLRGLRAETTAADRVLSAALVVFALLAPMLARSRDDGPPRAVVTVGRSEVAVLPLDRDAVVTVRGRRGDVRLRIENGAVRVTASECPQHVCIAQGAKRRPGEMIACVPNELLVRVLGGPPAPDVPDAVSR